MLHIASIYCSCRLNLFVLFFVFRIVNIVLVYIIIKKKSEIYPTTIASSSSIIYLFILKFLI